MGGDSHLGFDDSVGTTASISVVRQVPIMLASRIYLANSRNGPVLSCSRFKHILIVLQPTSDVVPRVSFILNAISTFETFFYNYRCQVLQMNRYRQE